MKTKKVLINCNITADCIYKIKTSDFHKFTDENREIYGFGFHKGEHSLLQAEKFCRELCAIIESFGVKVIEEAKIDNRTESLPRMCSSVAENPHVLESLSSNFIPDHFIPMGKLDILPAKPGKSHEDLNITDPLSVIHTNHGTYNISTRKYEGIPCEWLPELQKQFGVDAKNVETVRVQGYKGRIPSILLQLKDLLYSKGGLDVKGIFRLAPDNEESGFVKKQLNDGSFRDCKDVNCIANLIKV